MNANSRPSRSFPASRSTSVEALITPPQYANQTATNINLAQNPAIVAIGSQVDLRVHFNKILAAGSTVSIEPVGANNVPNIAWSTVDPSTAAGKWPAEQSLRFHVKATDVDGFKNMALEEYELIVSLISHRRSRLRTRAAMKSGRRMRMVPLVGVGEDDYGIQP
jgi:hypothetical protein